MPNRVVICNEAIPSGLCDSLQSRGVKVVFRKGKNGPNLIFNLGGKRGSVGFIVKSAAQLVGAIDQKEILEMLAGMNTKTSVLLILCRGQLPQSAEMLSQRIQSNTMVHQLFETQNENVVGVILDMVETLERTPDSFGVTPCVDLNLAETLGFILPDTPREVVENLSLISESLVEFQLMSPADLQRNLPHLALSVSDTNQICETVQEFLAADAQCKN